MNDSKRVHNPNATEVVYDTAGHTLPGCTSALADVDDPITARLIRVGLLVVPEEPAPEPEPVETPTKTTTKRNRSEK